MEIINYFVLLFKSAAALCLLYKIKFQTVYLILFLTNVPYFVFHYTLKLERKKAKFAIIYKNIKLNLSKFVSEIKAKQKRCDSLLI